MPGSAASGSERRGERAVVADEARTRAGVGGAQLRVQLTCRYQVHHDGPLLGYGVGLREEGGLPLLLLLCLQQYKAVQLCV